MSAIVHGSASGLIIQPGTKIVKKLDGSIQGVLVLEGDASYAGSSPEIGATFPVGGWNLICHESEIEYLKNGKVKCTGSYVGLQSDPTPWFLEGTGSLDKTPITAHPKFISHLGGTPSAPKNKCRFDPTTGEFQFFPADATNNLGGVDSFYTPQAIYRLTRWTFQTPTFSGLGLITTPPIPIPVEEGCNFLQGPQSFRSLGGAGEGMPILYQITSELWASSANLPWNALMYTTAES